MFRLLFQTNKDDKPEWIDSDNIEHLRDCRETMLAFEIANNKSRYSVEPFIKYIGKDGDNTQLEE